MVPVTYTIETKGNEGGNAKESVTVKIIHCDIHVLGRSSLVF